MPHSSGGAPSRAQHHGTRASLLRAEQNAPARRPPPAASSPPRERPGRYLARRCHSPRQRPSLPASPRPQPSSAPHLTGIWLLAGGPPQPGRSGRRPRRLRRAADKSGSVSTLPRGPGRAGAPRSRRGRRQPALPHGRQGTAAARARPPQAAAARDYSSRRAPRAAAARDYSTHSARARLLRARRKAWKGPGLWRCAAAAGPARPGGERSAARAGGGPLSAAAAGRPAVPLGPPAPLARACQRGSPAGADRKSVV